MIVVVKVLCDAVSYNCAVDTTLVDGGGGDASAGWRQLQKKDTSTDLFQSSL